MGFNHFDWLEQARTKSAVYGKPVIRVHSYWFEGSHYELTHIVRAHFMDTVLRYIFDELETKMV